MAIRPTIVCDVCGRETGAEHYAILLPGGVCWEVDLCKEHSKPLLEFRKKGIGRPRREARAQCAGA